MPPWVSEHIGEIALLIYILYPHPQAMAGPAQRARREKGSREAGGGANEVPREEACEEAREEACEADFARGRAAQATCPRGVRAKAADWA